MPPESAPEEIRRQVEAVWEVVGPDSSTADLILVVDEEVPLEDFDRVLFSWGTCSDPGRDCIIDEKTGGRRLSFDATSKAPGPRPGSASVRQYAPYIEMNTDLKTKVTSRWEEYGFEPPEIEDSH
jgi:3-polyprenyl-4-hydroxybenzoate decarboxylase